MELSRVLAIVLVLLVGGAIAFWIKSSGSSDGISNSPAPLPSVRAEPVESQAVVPPVSGDTSRTPIQPTEATELTGVVRSRPGGPIPGAQVEILCVTDEEIEWQGAWHADDWGPLERIRQSTESGADGTFHFSIGTRDASLGWVITVSHPTHAAGVLYLPPERSSWPSPLEIALEPAKSMTVTVVHPDGRPAAGATVEHYGFAPMERDNGAGGMTSERGQRLLHRTYATSASGTVEIGPYPGIQALRARAGTLASLPWKGRWQERVTLELAATFVVGGQVSMPSWPPQKHKSERRIKIAAQQRNVWRDLHTIRAVENGPWGPVSLPLVDADRYRIRLEGAPLVPAEVFLEAPAPGARLKRDLVAELGVELWFHVTDEENQVIPTASVRVEWQDPKDLSRKVSVEASRTASEQIGVRTVPSGRFNCTAVAPGYELRCLLGLETETFSSQYVALTLRKGARLKGRCLYRGAPVEDFEVIVWRPNLDDTKRASVFVDRTDGTFEFDSVPPGEVYVTASSPGTPACEPVAVSCTAGDTAEVTLELVDGLQGIGRVLDRATGLPVPDSAVQLFMKGDTIPVAEWGLPIPVDMDGSFSLDGFLPGANFIRVVAPGYSNQVVRREAQSSRIDWGDISLSRVQDFTLVLEPPERGPGSSVLVSTPKIQFPRKAFSEDGVVVLEGASAGSYGVSIQEPGNIYTFVELDWNPGEDWTLHTRVGGPNRLSVRVVSEQGNALSQVLWLKASYQSSQGFRTIRTQYPGSSPTVEFEGIDSSSVSVQAFDHEERVLATGSGTFQDGHLALELVLSDAHLVLTVVDPEGEPVPDVRVIVIDPDEPGFTLFGQTSASGECRLDGVPARVLMANLEHASKGTHFGIPIDASVGAATVVLDGRAKLELRFQDGETLLEGVSCAVLDHTGSVMVSGPVSDADGRITIRGLGPVAYALRGTRPDCWPAEFVAEARVEGEPTVVQMRRLATLELAVTGPNGLPASGLAVELRSLEFGVEIAEWIRAERVRSAGSVTDARGRIRVEGLPRGAYRWRVAWNEGLEGELEVQPGTTAPLSILLP